MRISYLIGLVKFVGRKAGTGPSFTQLDGGGDNVDDDIIDEEEVKEEEEKEEEEILPHVLCDYGVHALHEFYAIPPAKIRHPYYGIGTFKSIDPGGRYLYDVGMENPIRVYNKPQAPKPYF